MYILIMTLVLVGNSGMSTGQSNIKTSSLDECDRIGSVWKQSMKGFGYKAKAKFICIELGKD